MRNAMIEDAKQAFGELISTATAGDKVELCINERVIFGFVVESKNESESPFSDDDSLKRCANIFLFFDNGMCCEYGFAFHDLRGSDESKFVNLKNSVRADFDGVERFRVRHKFHRSEYVGLFLERKIADICCEALDKYDFYIDFLYVITHVVDGVLILGEGSDLDNYCGELTNGVVSVPDDWFSSYFSSEGVDLGRLINDDFIEPIKLLFNNKYYCNSFKLLSSMIDSIAFLDMGDERGNFKKWLDLYVDMDGLGVDSNEIWELRNSVLHMTNLNSRKVNERKVRKISFYVGSPTIKGLPSIINDELDGFFNLFDFMSRVWVGVGKWLESYNCSIEKRDKFFQRYNLILSDKRMAEYRP